MESSDDEAEAQLLSVSNYHFVDDDDEPTSFSVVPIQWSDAESPGTKQERVFLKGTADNGLKTIYMPVIAWKFDIFNVKPEISVLSKENKWIKLQKPRKSFEDTIRTILITIYVLHFMKRNPEASEKSMWDHLSKVFSCYEVRPSQNDLLDHMPLIGESVKRDDTLTKSKVLLSFLQEKPRKKKLTLEDIQTLERPRFIVDDMDDEMTDASEEDDSDIGDGFDSVCSICDNGGNLLCCEDKCMRSFHATEEDGEFMCASLGLSQDEVDAIQSFICKNCQYKQHQCFACGKLGSSDKSSNAEVFCCSSATCGYFYHPHCVAKLLHPDNEHLAKEVKNKISVGGSFTCPIHKCCVCRGGENKKVDELQFAVCRRCPQSYHRKCLPRKISFEDKEDEGIITRAWNGLLTGSRILIYCLKHEIVDELGTPKRDHIKFPFVNPPVEENDSTFREKSKKIAAVSLTQGDKIISKTSRVTDESSQKKDVHKVPKLTERSYVGGVSSGTKRAQKTNPGSDVSRKLKVNNASQMCLNESKKSIPREMGKTSFEDYKPSIGNQLFALWDPEQGELVKKSNVVNKTQYVKSAENSLRNALPQLDADSQRRLLALVKDASLSITLENVKEKRKVSETRGYSLKNVVEKTITFGKLEGSVDAVGIALSKLDEGCSIEDAEAVCDPDILSQIFKWKKKLKVYLAPVLNGNRYSSFGRHFTQVEKLEKIVDKLHWYVESGDTVVDFCCGANDFSILLSKKLEATGKKCLYKNYDLFPTKKDFNFEMKDWMTVQSKELPKGSQLIMGLNPPFGVKASLANQFIDKALEFKPKLIILIVPPETKRLDQKHSPYNLVWEDDMFLAGKAFYLPGSVDVNEKQMEQWNVRTPLLFLWSRPDWTAKHKVIAQEHGHILNECDRTRIDRNPMGSKSHTEAPCLESSASDHIMDDNGHCDDDFMLTDDLMNNTSELEDSRDQESVNEVRRNSSSLINLDLENQESHDQWNCQSDKSPTRRSHSVERVGSGIAEVSPTIDQEGERLSANGKKEGTTEPTQSNASDRKSPMVGFSDTVEVEDGRLSANEQYRGVPGCSAPNVFDSRYSTGLSKPFAVPEDVGIDNYSHRHFKPHFSGSRIEYGTTYHGNHSWSGAPTSVRDYGARNLKEPYKEKLGDSASGFVYRPYISEVEEKLRRESIARERVRLYGLGASYLGSSYEPVHDPGYAQVGSLISSYGHIGSAMEMSYRAGTSTMQRYAPRLDERNPAQRSTLGSNQGMPRPGYHVGPGGFASAPHPSSYSSQHNSTGWFD